MSLYNKNLIYTCQFVLLLAAAQAADVFEVEALELPPLGDKLVSAGGMLADQQTTDRVTGFSLRR